MHSSILSGAAGLALSVAAPALAQTYLMVPNATGGIMLFSPVDGSVVNPSFIPESGPAWDNGVSVLRQACQVGNEIWITVQANNTIWRFDLNGKYYGKITGYIGNNRGMHVDGGVVYVNNTSAQGPSQVGIVKLDPATGAFVSTFAAGTTTAGNWDVTVHAGIVYISDDTSVQTYDTSGASLGAWGPATLTGLRQITRLPSGNFLIANNAPAGTLGFYEFDPAGAQLAFRSTSVAVDGVAPLSNGNFLYTGGNIWVYNTATGLSTQVGTGTSHYVEPLTVNAAAVGACCFLDGTCDVRSIGDCGAGNGVFRGDGTACATAACPPVGACCAVDGSCSILPADYCTSAGNIWRGPGTLCASADCPIRLITTGGTILSASTDGNGIFMDLTPNTDITVGQIDYYPAVTAGTPVVVDVYTRPGSYIGNDGDPAGWTRLATFGLTSQGNLSSSPATPLVLTATPLPIAANQTVGVYIVGSTGGYRYRSSTGANPVTDANLALESNIGRATLFGGAQSTGRRFHGAIHYRLGIAPECYANCDASTATPILNVADFTCFLTKYASGDPYANCDQSTTEPTLNVADFTCFLTKYAAGCP